MMDGESRFRRALLDLFRSSGNPLTLKVEGNSMKPSLSGAQGVTIDFCEASTLAVGDILAYEAGDTVVVHRVLAKRVREGRVEIYQKGDNQQIGTWVNGEQVLGRVSEVQWINGTRFRLPAPSWTATARCRIAYIKLTCTPSWRVRRALPWLRRILHAGRRQQP